MDISFESNIRAWTADMTDIQRRVMPTALAKALTFTAQDVRDVEQQAMLHVFDRPTRFTINSLFYLSARASDPSPFSRVYFKDSSRASKHYLLPQVEGGPRPIKRFEKWLIGRGIMKSGEFAVPAKGLKLDAYGNIPGNVFTQILSQLAASPDAHQWETERSRKRAGPSRARYFVPAEGRLARGIWRKQGKTLQPVLIFVQQPTYSARFDFFGIGQREAERRFPEKFWRLLDAEVRRSNRS